MAEPGAVLLVPVAGGVVFATLLAAGTHHLARPGRLAGAVAERGRPPVPSRVVAGVLAVAETLIGLAGLVAVVVGPADARVSAAAAGLCAVFAVDAARVLRSGAAVRCGCGATDHPVNQWVAVRAASYVGLAVVAALPAPPLQVLDPLPALTVVVAVATVGPLLWWLPRTLAVPAGFGLRS